MKIRSIPLHTGNNYGSALQTYATQTVLRKLGHMVEFVDFNIPICQKVIFLLVVFEGRIFP